MIVALVGLYGVMAHAVARRTREIGIRIAVGAEPRRCGGMILGESLATTLGGVAGGLLLGDRGRPAAGAASSWTSRLRRRHVHRRAGGLVAAAVAAAWVPARRATEVNPTVGAARRIAAPRRPGQRPSAEHVQVQVEHRLPGVGVAVEHGAVAALGVAALGGDCRGSPHHRADQAVVRTVEVVQRGDVRSRHDQHMHGRLRVDVLEGHEVVVLEHLLRRNLAGDDAAEQAAHARSIGHRAALQPA